MFDKIFDLAIKTVLFGVVTASVIIVMISMVHAEQPKYLKDAKITVTLKNGTTYTFNANEHKIVSRDSMPCPAPKVKLPKKFPPLKYTRSRFTLYSGIGYDGLKLNSVNNVHTIEKQSAPVIGIGYSYKIFGNYSVGGTALSNETYLINFGFDF